MNCVFSKLLQQQQAISTPSLSRVGFGQGNLLCIFHTQVTLSQLLFPASSTQPCLPLALPESCPSQLPSKSCPLQRLTFRLIYMPIPQVVPPVPGLGPRNNSKQATFTIYWEPLLTHGFLP